MDAALQEAGRLLSRISPDRAGCLDAVTKCQPLITWLRGTVKGTFFISKVWRVINNFVDCIHVSV